MELSILLDALAQAGVTVVVAGDDLEARPASKLTPEQRESLRENKPALLAHLSHVETINELPPELAAEALAGRLKRLGYHVAVFDGQLDVSGQPLTPEIRNLIRQHKERLIALLDCETDVYTVEERRSIMWADTLEADPSLRQIIHDIEKAGGMDNWFETLESPTDEFFRDCDRDKHDWIMLDDVERCRLCGKLYVDARSGYHTKRASGGLRADAGSNQQPLFKKD